jgi:RNA polymerase sigma factor for flagellar operon FliA
MRVQRAEPLRRDDLRNTWRRFRATRDPDLRDRLIRHYIGLVRTVAGRLALRLPPHLCLDDLESSGMTGFLAAVEGFDPDKDVDFATYAQPRIRGAILDELRDLDPLPRSIREKARRIERAIATLEQRDLKAPTDEEVASFMGMSLEAYHSTLQELRGGLHVSLDGGRAAGEEGEEGGEVALAASGAQTPDPWRALALKERRLLLASILEDLPAGERMVLSLYYYEELTMKEIGAVLTVSESRVSQLHSAALLRIRARLRSHRLRREDLHVEERSLWDRSGVARAIS